MWFVGSWACSLVLCGWLWTGVALAESVPPRGKATQVAQIKARLVKRKRPPKARAKAPKAKASVSRYQRFIRKIQKQLKTKPRSARLRTILGRLYQRDGALQKAKKQYKLALRLRPGYSHALVGLAHLSLRAGKPRQARRLLARVLRRKPRHASAWAEQSEMWRMLALRARKRPKRKDKLLQKSVNALQKAVVYRPRSHRFRYRLGILYLGQRKAVHANIQFAAAHAMLPIHPCYKLGLGVSESLLMRKRPTLYKDLKDGVMQCQHPLLSGMGRSMLVVVAMQGAQEFVAKRKLGKAIALMREATLLAPHIHSGFFFLALLQYQNQQCGKARQTLQALLQRAPKHALAKKLLLHSKALRCGPLPSRRFFRKTDGVLQRMRARQKGPRSLRSAPTPRHRRRPAPRTR